MGQFGQKGHGFAGVFGGEPTSYPASRKTSAKRSPAWLAAAESISARAMAVYQNRWRSRGGKVSGFWPNSRTNSGSQRVFFSQLATSRQPRPVETTEPSAWT